MDGQRRLETLAEILRMQEEVLALGNRRSSVALAADKCTESASNESDPVASGRSRRKVNILSPVVETSFEKAEKNVNDYNELVRKYLSDGPVQNPRSSLLAETSQLSSLAGLGGTRKTMAASAVASTLMASVPPEEEARTTTARRERNAILDEMTRIRTKMRRNSLSQPQLPTCGLSKPEIHVADAELSQLQRVSPAYKAGSVPNRLNDSLMTASASLKDPLAKTSNRRASTMIYEEIVRRSDELRRKSFALNQSTNMSMANPRSSVGSIPITPKCSSTQIRPKLDADSVVMPDLGYTPKISSTFRPNESSIQAIKKEVHEENMSIISAMTDSEIQNIRSGLRKSMKPSDVDILRRFAAESTTKPTAETPLPRHSEDISCKLPIDVSANSSWSHMNVMEMDKLQWTSDVVVGEQKSTSPPAARFDLQGNLLPSNAQLPVKLGLHHHGDEPERAGYTLEELLYLSRSSVLSQRTLAVTTLSRIARNAALGLFEGQVEPPVMSILLEVNCFAILKLCLTDGAPASVAASLRFIESMLCLPAEEELLDQTLECCGSLAQPWLRPNPEAPNLNAALSDEDCLKVDVIQALMRMSLLERVEAIFQSGLLKVGTPVADNDASTVGITVINILVRLARHSKEVAQRILDCKSVLREAVNSCLACASTAYDAVHQEAANYFPQAKALKLLRVLCLADKSIAKQLMTDYDVKSLVMLFSQREPMDICLPPVVACQAVAESFRLWRCLLFYGCLQSQVGEVIGYLQMCTVHLRGLLQDQFDFSRPHFSFIRLRLIVALMEGWLIMDHESRTLAAVKAYYMEFCVTFHVLVNAFVNAIGRGTVDKSYLLLIGAMLNFIGTCFHFRLPDTYLPPNGILDYALKRFMTYLPSLTRSLCNWSYLLQQRTKCEQVKGLPPTLGLHCMLNKDGQWSPFPLLASWTRLLYYIKTCCPSEEVYANMNKLSLPPLYLDKLLWQSRNLVHMNYFSRFEVFTLYYHAALDRDATNLLLPNYLTVGQEALHIQCNSSRAANLRKNCPLCHGQGVIGPYQSVEDLNVSMTAVETTDDFPAWLKTVYACLAEIQYTLGKVLEQQYGLTAIDESRALYHTCGFLTERLDLQSFGVKQWWVPLSKTLWWLEAIRLRLLDKIDQPESSTDSEELKLIICGLLWTYYTIYELHIIELGNVYCYLSLIFRTEYYREPMVYQCLSALLRHFLSETYFEFKCPWQGQTFQQVFVALLNSFQEHSYSDALFARYVLLPIMDADMANVLKECLAENEDTVKMLYAAVKK